ncbi:hypothetical protein O1L60_35810 [Streptomyces diastatochromogenes]|nr:hypothetical protein [Streptomyces diastatochromogenes]
MGGAPYAFGAIANFGGHTSLGANTGVWTERFHSWLAKSGSALRGIAWLPEGTGGNPASFDLFTELAWEPGPVDQRAWFAAYAARRYGGPTRTRPPRGSSCASARTAVPPARGASRRTASSRRGRA